MNTRITELGNDVKSKLESGLVITDATQCALELVENALDAKCTAVAVRINLKNFTIEVVDNGMGISLDDLNLIGERYMTSKCKNSDDLERNMETFGYRGQALASILDVCTELRIKTKSEFSKTTFLKVFTKGKSPSVTIVNKGKNASGTTVTVSGFMSTMPVRQRRITEILDIKEIRNQLEYLALIHSEVCFTLRDESKGEIIFESRNRKNGELSFADLYGMALGKFLVPLICAQRKMEIQGFIGLRKHFEDNLQFFYVNKRIISKSIIHKVVNSLIDRYLNEWQTLTEESPVAGGGVNFNGNKNCHNVFLVQIRCPYVDFLMFRNLRKTTVEFKNWDNIFYCLKNAIKAALKGESSHVASNHVIEKRKNEKLYKLSDNNEMELGQLRCGIRGVCVKRKRRQILSVSKNEAMTHRIKFNRKTLVNCANERSFADDIKSNSSLKYEMLSHLPSNTNKIDGEHESRTPVPVHTKNTEENQYFSGMRRSGSADGDVSTEFADWLKAKIHSDIFIRTMYREFVEQRLTRKVKAVPQKRKQGTGNERIYEGKQLVRERKKAKTCVPQRKSNEGNLERIPEVIHKKVNGFKRDSISHLQDKRKVSGNSDLPKLFSLPRSIGIENGDSSKSWTSHKNRRHSNKKYRDQSAKISWIFSDKTEASKKQKEFANFSRRPHIGADIFQKFSRDAAANGCVKADQSRKEARMGTTTVTVGCDKEVQINLQDLDDPLNTCRRCATSKMGENKTRELLPLSGKLAEDGVNGDDDDDDDDDATKVLTSELETNFSDESKNIIASVSPKSPFENSLPICQEIIRSKELKEASMNICEMEDECWTRKEKKSEEGVKRNSSTGDFGITTGIAPYSTIGRHDPRPHSDDCKGLGNFFFREDIPARNVLPQALVVGDEEYTNSGNGPRVFSCRERYSFIPKGLSPTVLERSFNKVDSRNENISEEIYEAPKEKSCEVSRKSLLPDDCIDELKEKTVENMVYYESQVIKSSAMLKKTESKTCTWLSSFDVDKDVLSNIQVIGQWDKKFIVVKTCPLLRKEKSLLLLFDQHAVDERIQLEKLMKDSRNMDGKFIAAKCSPPVKCKLEESTLRLIPALQTLLLNFGVKISVLDSEYALIFEIPTFLTQDNADEVVTFLKNLVKDVVEEFSATRGSGSTFPAAIYSKMSTKACKSAVKFNDALSPDKMAKMINDLVACQNPFQCAHGRPSAVPVLDLEAFQNKVTTINERLNYEKLRKMNVKK